MRFFRFVLGSGLVAALCLVTACGSSPTSPSTPTTLTTTDLQIGSGTEAAKGNTVAVHYTVWLYDASGTDKKGLQIETSRGGDPFSFVLGNGEVIAGWDQGVPGMRAGGVRRLVVPPALAYGDSRRNAIPPNSSLVFEIELISVQ